MNDWIPTKERLPEITEWVLVDINGGIYMAYFDGVAFMAEIWNRMDSFRVDAAPSPF